MTKIRDCHDLPKANHKSQAPEPRQSKQNAAHPNASEIPPGKAELRKRKSQERSTKAENCTILDNIQIRRDKVEENQSDEKSELRKKWLLNARKKHLQAPFMSDMIDYFQEKKDWKFERKFTRTYHCRDEYQITHDGQALTLRCENRWCNSCSNMRAIRLRDRYQKPLSALDEVWFVTLTGMAVMPGEGRLKERLLVYKKVWSKLIGKYKKRAQRSGDYSRIRGLRKLEIEISKNILTFGYFHPHFHVITEGTESFMREFMSDWVAALQKHGIKASMKAQKAVRAERDENGHIKMSELTKYVTKSLVEDPETGELKQVAPAAFAEIWEAVQGIRLIHPIDIKGELADDEEEDGDADHMTASQPPPDARPGFYSWAGSDWKGRPVDASNESEEVGLTGYEPDTPTTEKHHRPRPEWLTEDKKAAAKAIERAMIKMRVNRLIDMLPESLPEPEPDDTKKEGEP
jgi:hypothetical protein